jgi:hypothetical protein
MVGFPADTNGRRAFLLGQMAGFQRILGFRQAVSPGCAPHAAVQAAPGVWERSVGQQAAALLQADLPVA